MPKKKKVTKAKKTPPISARINLAWRNFILFLILFILSFVLYSFSSSSLFLNFFGVLSIILGFLAFAFLIALVVLLILNAAKKK